MSLTHSSFAPGERDVAIELAETNVGLSLDATQISVSGKLSARQLRVGGHLRLDGSTVARPDEGVALDLSRSVIGGELRLCFGGDEKSFIARGGVLVAASKVGALVMRGAQLDGLGSPALIADEMQTVQSVDLGGLSAQGHASFSARGVLRFIRLNAGGQFQLYDATLVSEDGKCLILDSCKIDGDLLIGEQSTKTICEGQISVAAGEVGGRVFVWNASLQAGGSALVLRQCDVRGEVALYDVDSKGAILLDGNHLGGLSIQNLVICRTAPQPDMTNLPAHYIHELDSLLDLNFCDIRGDVSIDLLNLEGGDFRFGNASIGGLFRLTRFKITACRSHALMGQSAKLRDGVYIAGSADQPSIALGDFHLLGAEVGRGLTIVDVQFGSSETLVDVQLSGSRVDGTVLIHRSTIYGEFNAASARVGADMRFDGVRFINRGCVAADFRGVVVQGALVFNAVARTGESAQLLLDGNLVADGAQLGALTWSELEVARGAKLSFTNMLVARMLTAGPLLPESSGELDLSGTTAGSLVDGLDDREDQWGGGKLRLGLDSFNYQYLAHPSGRVANDANSIRFWRRIWLERRLDQSSTRAARRLAKVLRDQGLHEASRLVLIDAFSAEGRLKPTLAERLIAQIFGLTFGHGFSGWRAFATLLALWIVGTGYITSLESGHLLVRATSLDSSASKPVDCGDAVNLPLYAADVILPVLHFGQQSKCEVGLAPGATGIDGGRGIQAFDGEYVLFGTVGVAQFLLTAYALLGWLVVSLSIATWSGLFRRAGRD